MALKLSVFAENSGGVVECHWKLKVQENKAKPVNSAALF